MIKKLILITVKNCDYSSYCVLADDPFNKAHEDECHKAPARRNHNHNNASKTTEACC